MSAYLEPVLWITVAVLLLGSLVVVLRTPLRLLDLRTRMGELELRFEALDAAHKKAVRKWGMEAKKTAPKPSPTDDEPDDPELPFPPPPPAPSERRNGPASEDPLLAIRREWTRRQAR